MNEQRLVKLLRDVDERQSAPCGPDASRIAATARAIRRDRQRRVRQVTATLSMLVMIGSVGTMMRWQNHPHIRPRRTDPPSSPPLLAVRSETDRMDAEASERWDAIQAVARSNKAQQAQEKATKSRWKLSQPRDVTLELNVQRERAGAIILQAADQLREAGRSDLAVDRYHDLISLFPDTAAAQMARDRIEPSKNRT